MMGPLSDGLPNQTTGLMLNDQPVRALGKLEEVKEICNKQYNKRSSFMNLTSSGVALSKHSKSE